MVPPFLTSALDSDELSASRPSPFTPGKEPRYWLNWRLGVPRSSLDVLKYRKFSCTCGELNSVVHLVVFPDVPYNELPSVSYILFIFTFLWLYLLFTVLLSSDVSVVRVTEPWYDDGWPVNCFLNQIFSLKFWSSHMIARSYRSW
jgi:hypothetical protein